MPLVSSKQSHNSEEFSKTRRDCELPLIAFPSPAITGVTGHMTASQTAQSALPTTGYIRRFRMPALLGVSMPTIDRWVKNGTLPRPVKLTNNVTAFDAVEINNWLAERRGKAA